MELKELESLRQDSIPRNISNPETHNRFKSFNLPEYPTGNIMVAV